MQVIAVPLSRVPAWINRYVGIPYLLDGTDLSGCDCWTLCDIILKERTNISMPPLKAVTSLQWKQIKQEQVPEDWREVNAAEAKELDIITLRYLREMPPHVGVVVAPGWMIHTQEGVNSILDDYTSFVFKNRIESFYRHASNW